MTPVFRLGSTAARQPAEILSQPWVSHMSNDQKPVNRRFFLGRVAAGAAVAGGALNLITGGTAAAITDNDPDDPSGNGRGRGYRETSDRDPYDPAVGDREDRRTGYTDRDPSDPSGNGRRGRGTGITDRDPNDHVVRQR